MNINQLGNSFNSHLEKQFILILPSQPNSPKTNRDSTGKPVAQEVVVGVLQEEPSSSDSTGRPVAREEQHVQTHDSSGKPESKEAQHIVQEKENREHRETVDKFDLATNDANIDFSVSGIPEETVETFRNHEHS